MQISGRLKYIKVFCWSYKFALFSSPGYWLLVGATPLFRGMALGIPGSNALSRASHLTYRHEHFNTQFCVNSLVLCRGYPTKMALPITKWPYQNGPTHYMYNVSHKYREDWSILRCPAARLNSRYFHLLGADCWKVPRLLFGGWRSECAWQIGPFWQDTLDVYGYFHPCPNFNGLGLA